MSSIICAGTIKLYCGIGTSNKEYQFNIWRNDEQSDANKLTLDTTYGSVGKLYGFKPQGIYSSKRLRTLITAKVVKGYQISTVNDRPYLSGSVEDAILLIENGNNWNAIQTAQPVQKLKYREVLVTFDVGTMAPVW